MDDHQKITALLKRVNTLGFVELKRLFYLMRNGNIKISDAMMQVALRLVRQFKKPLKNEYYFMLQELFYAGLDLQLIHNSDQVLRVLLRQFPKNDNVGILKGVLLECSDKPEEAQAQYEQLIQENLLEQHARKRKISLLRRQDKITEAVDQLNTFLLSFPQDHEAWLELADIYLTYQNYSRALFCYEELLLNNPNDQHYVVKVAELYYTNGGQQNFEIAKNYYCFALSHNSQNIRALWGLLQTLKKMAPKVENQEKKTQNRELAKLSVEAIRKIYTLNGTQQLIAGYPFEKLLSEI